MKKMTLAIALTCMAALAFSQVSFKEVWEYSKANAKLPAYIGSGSECRSMAVGKVDGKDVVAVATRVGGANIILLDPMSGEERSKLSMKGVLGGHPSFPINTVEISADGVILGGNLAAAAGQHFKIYAWDKTNVDPVVLLDYPAVAKERFGDSFMVLGNVKDGSAKLYAVNSTKTNPLVMVLPMVKSGSNWVFDLTKRTNYTLPHSAIPSALDRLPNGNFIFGTPGQPVMELAQDDANKAMKPVATHMLPGSAMSIYVSGPIYITSKYNNVYVGALGYSNDQHCGVVAKISDNHWENATVAGKTSKFHSDGNAGGTGRIRAWEENGKLYVYVLETENGIGKYEMNITVTSLDEVAYKVTFEQVAGRLSVKGIEASSIEVFNLLGQSVRASRLSNEVETTGLRGAYLVQVKADGRLVKSEKVIIR